MLDREVELAPVVFEPLGDILARVDEGKLIAGRWLWGKETGDLSAHCVNGARLMGVPRTSLSCPPHNPARLTRRAPSD